MNFDVGLSQLKSRINSSLQQELNLTKDKFLKIKSGIDVFVSSSPLAYQSFEDISRGFPSPQNSVSPWGFFVGYELLPDIGQQKGELFFPIIHAFQGVNATAIEEGNDCTDLLLNIAIRSIASYPLGSSIVYMMDSNMGGDFNQFSPISTDITDLDSEKNQFHYITLQEEKDEALKGIAQIIDANIKSYVSQYPDVATYNRQNTSMAVPYRFLIIRDIVGSLTDNQIQQLTQLIHSGNATKAGVYLFYTYRKDDLTQTGYGSISNNLQRLLDLSKKLEKPTQRFSASQIQIETKASDNEVKKTIEFVRTQKTPSLTMSFKDEINKQLDSGVLWNSIYGENGKLYFKLGFDTPTKAKEVEATFDYGSPHIFVGGKTGSGKSVLLHNFILNGALRYSPDELRFYLVDMKSGVSFAFYKNLPHVAALSASYDRHYALSVLKRFVEDINIRGTEFKKENVTKISDYNEKQRANNRPILPYNFAIIDEFQELYSKNDIISNNAAELIKKIHKEGRSAGVFLALCTQSIGGINTDISQVGIKLSLVTNRNDSVKLIGNEEAARLRGKGRAILNLSEEGEAKYNEEFQVAFVDEAKELPVYVEKIKNIYLKQNNNIDTLDHLVYDDNDLTAKISDNEPLINLLRNKTTNFGNMGGDYIYLGMPSFCRKEHVKFFFHRNSQSNVVIVGNDRPVAMRLIGLTALQFSMGYTNSEIVISDLQNDTDKTTLGNLSFLSKINQVKYTKANELIETIKYVYDKLTYRESNPQTSHKESEMLYVIVDFKPHSAFNIKKDPFGGSTEPTPSEMLDALITRGPDSGIHIVLYAYNANNIESVMPDAPKNMEVKIGIRGGNPVKVLNGFGQGEVVDANGKAFIRMPEDMGLTYIDGDIPGDPFVVYDAVGDKGLEQTPFGYLFNSIPNKK